MCICACLAAPSGGTELKYTHYSVVMNKDRRLAFVSAVNIDGANRVTGIGRDDDFILDPRLDKGYQVGNELYKSNPLDRGHLTRRQDPIWGTVQEAEVREAQLFPSIMIMHVADVLPWTAV